MSARSAKSLAIVVWKNRRILASMTRDELRRRYSGSAFGLAWVVIYPTLLLGIYLFVYRVIARMRLPGQTEMDYVVFVFCGLLPYLGFTEAVTASCFAIKQNIHLVKNVMLPIELIPVRTVAVALLTQSIALILVTLLAALNGDLSLRLAWLPLLVVLQAMLLIGLALVVGSVAVGLPDVAYLVNLGVLFLMFVSPIGFKPDMVPSRLLLTVYGNPVFYMTDAFRMSIIGGYPFSLTLLAVYALLAIASFVLGAAFFKRFKGILVDYE
jgi:lipopolysaccharide transport system permease protein